jgi:hypothetical protein
MHYSEIPVMKLMDGMLVELSHVTSITYLRQRQTQTDAVD